MINTAADFTGINFIDLDFEGRSKWLDLPQSLLLFLSALINTFSSSKAAKLINITYRRWWCCVHGSSVKAIVVVAAASSNDVETRANL